MGPYRTILRGNNKQRGDQLAALLANMTCGYKHCHEPATALLIEIPWHQGKVFEHGAGICCNKHAHDAERGGCAKRMDSQ